MICPNCKKDVTPGHFHSCAHGMPETHMSGSEYYKCPECEHHLSREEAKDVGLVYVLDKDY